MIYGYARISTKKQSIDRQIRNIKSFNNNAIILQEEYTGTKVSGRAEFEKLLKKVNAGDTIIFDSVSRMSRNADEGIKLYFELFDKGVNLIFLKERYIDTDTYKKAISSHIQTVGTKEDILINAINEYLKELAKEQIKIAFEQAEKEVTDLQQRTKEGLQTAKLNGKQVGRAEGTKVTTRKSIEAKRQIVKLHKDFKGTNNDKEVMKITGIARNTYYRYKKELLQNGFWENNL